jgi:hypothetical protein
VTDETARRFSLADNSPQAAAERNVPRNPRPLCSSFAAQAAPAEFWCLTCGWNRPMHDSDEHRAAIAGELRRRCAADHRARLADFDAAARRQRAARGTGGCDTGATRTSIVFPAYRCGLWALEIGY